MDTVKRAFEIEREGINLETGEFPLVLASEAETSDGHILNIRGVNVPDKMPLQVSHMNSPLMTLGSITRAKPGTKKGVPVLRALGQIELGGEGPQADIRRDLAYMISEGHVSAVSIRAEGTKVVPRTQLPKNHRAYVDPDEKDFVKRFGLFFEESNALEGSIVALGADKNAIIGRSRETEGEVQEFWRGFVEEESQDRKIPEEEEIKHDTSEIQDVRSLEKFLGEMPGISRKEARRLASIKTETTQPPRDAQEQKRPELTEEEIRQAVRSELSQTMTGIQEEVSEIINDALGRVRVRKGE